MFPYDEYDGEGDMNNFKEEREIFSIVKKEKDKKTELSKVIKMEGYYRTIVVS